jgi:hypothetical protein
LFETLAKIELVHVSYKGGGPAIIDVVAGQVLGHEMSALVESVGVGVTSSILPILRPFLARALMADWAPGPGVFDMTPPIPRSLMWMALMPTILQPATTSTAASIAV